MFDVFVAGVMRPVRSTVATLLLPTVFDLAFPTSPAGEPILDASKLPAWDSHLALGRTESGSIGV
jgi:hypothetical protein